MVAVVAVAWSGRRAIHSYDRAAACPRPQSMERSLALSALIGECGTGGLPADPYSNPRQRLISLSLNPRTCEFSRGMVGSAGTCQPAAAARRTQARRRARPAYVRTTPGFAGIAADGHPVTAMVGARRLVGEAVAVAGAPPGLTSLAWPFLQHNCAATCIQSTHDQAWFMC